MGGATQVISLSVVAAAVAFFTFIPLDGAGLLKGGSSSFQLGHLQLQAAITGFCLSPLPADLMREGREIDEVNDHQSNLDFEQHGEIMNDDYDKGTIYSLLYSLYADAGTVTSDMGKEYQFTFNTWGISPSPYPEDDPERYGKAAYAGLWAFPAVKSYIKNLAAKGETPLVVEIGCGTGAGANLCTRELVPEATYFAIDMQKAAIETCKSRHATEDNSNLKCIHVPSGVGVGGAKVVDPDYNTVADNSVDFVVISETHIADVEVGPEEIEIFNEVLRVLKPGGMLLWGNALPTRVWNAAYAHLSANGFERTASLNHTMGAVEARDLDAPRVNAYCDSLFGKYPIFNAPVVGERCHTVVDRLLKNFYRHPGTALYLKMVTGFDSYMHEVYQKKA